MYHYKWGRKVAKLFLLALSPYFILVTSACFIPSAERPNINAETIEAGVVVHGFFSPGYIQHNNSFPVRIKGVYISKGEITQWIKVFQPGEKKEIDRVYIQHG